MALAAATTSQLGRYLDDEKCLSASFVWGVVAGASADQPLEPPPKNKVARDVGRREPLGTDEGRRLV